MIELEVETYADTYTLSTTTTATEPDHIQLDNVAAKPCRLVHETGDTRDYAASNWNSTQGAKTMQRKCNND